MKYLNMRTSQGVETVDELSSEEFKTRKEFRAELSRLVGEYHLCGMPVYVSTRCTREWKEK